MPVQGLERVNQRGLRAAWLEFGQRDSLFSGSLVSFLVPHVEAGWFNLCVSHVRLSATANPFLAASVWEQMKECACHTGSSHQSSSFPCLTSHAVVAWTLDGGAGLGHCFWLQVFFLQANGLLLVVAVSPAGHVRKASWLLKRHPGVVTY